MNPSKWLLALAAALTLCGPAMAADNMTVKDSTGSTVTVRSKDTGAGVQAPTHTVADSSGAIVDPATAGKQDTGNTSLASIDTKTLAPYAVTATTTITRPADTTTYAVNDTLADSTSAPTSGGFTLSSVCSASGKTSRINTLVVVSSNDPATPLAGEIWLFNTSVTAVNDNAAFALSDADSIKLVGKIPFNLETSQAGSGTNSIFVASGLDLGVTCSGSANLRFLVKVKNAYVPAASEQLQVSVTVRGDN